MTIKEHLVDVQTSIGVVTYIQTERKNRPKGLRKPYEYILPIKDANSLYQELKTLLKPYEKTCQCAGASKKNVSYGMKLNLFVLGYVPGFCGDDECGLNRKEWQSLCKEIQEIFYKFLGKDARIYAEKFTKTEKFQARFETYIAYTETLP